MGNELSACACGQKKDIDDERRPLEKPELAVVNKPKKKGKLFTKKRKKKDHIEKDCEESSARPGSNPDVKDVIVLDIQRPAVWQTQDGPIPGLSASPVSPGGGNQFDNAANPGTQRTLYPPTTDTKPYVRIAPAKPRRLSAQSSSGNQLPTRNGTLVRFSDDDIDVVEPVVTIHEDINDMSSHTRSVLSMSETLGKVLNTEQQSHVQHKLSRRDRWLAVDETIREQYDIVYVADVNDDVDCISLHEIVVIIQRQEQRIFVLINPNSISLQMPNQGLEKSKINLSPAAKPPPVNGIPAPQPNNAPAVSRNYLSRSTTTPLPTKSVHTKDPTKDNELAFALSNLQSSRLRATSQSQELNKTPQSELSTTKTPSLVTQQSMTFGQPEWKAKGSSPSPTFKPVKMEVASHAQILAEPGVMYGSKKPQTKLSSFAEPSEQYTALRETGTASPPSPKKVDVPIFKVAAVALITNKLKAAQLKENAFTAELKSELKPVSKPPAVGRYALEKSKSEDSSLNKKELKVFRSLDSPSEHHILSKKASTSSSSSLSDASETTARSTPPRTLPGLASFKDRLAKFNSTENLLSSVSPAVKRSNGELHKSPGGKTAGIETRARQSKLISSESDQSRDSSTERSQSKPLSTRSGLSVSANQSVLNNKFKEKNTTASPSPPPKPWKTTVNNNHIKEGKDSSPEMKWKATPYSSGLKSAPTRTTLPVFTNKLRNHYGRQGDPLKLQCRVDGEPKPVISWLKEGKLLTGDQRIKCYEQNGVHYLEITSTLKEDSGRYTVKAVNSKGNAHCSADVEIAGRKPNITAEKTPKSVSDKFRTPSSDEKNKKNAFSSEINKQVDEFHLEANEMMAELDSLTPRSAHNGHVTSSSHCSAPSFNLKLSDCQVEEGERLDLTCTTEGEDPGLDHSPPQFVKILHDEVVEEGDSVTIECRNPHDDDHGMRSRAPEFTQKLSDHEVTEGDSVTIEVHGSHDYHEAAAPKFVQELQDEEVTEGETVTIQCKSPQQISSTGAPVFVEKLHDLVAEEGSSLTLECQSPFSKSSPDTKCTPPSFVTKLADHEVEEGDSVTIECKGPNDHPHSHSYKTEYVSQASPTATTTQKPSDTTQHNLKSTDRISPPRFLKHLKDDQVEEGDSLTISCKSPAHILPQTQKPVFLQSLTNQEIEEGDSVTLSCTSHKSPSPADVLPPKFLKELRDEEVTEGESLVIECSQVSPLTPSTLPSTADSSFASSASTPPSIQRELVDVSVVVGNPAELVMETSGSLPLDIVWVHNEDELNPDDPDYVQLSDGHTHRLLISAAFPDDSGTYICEAYNDFGEADSACELLVLDDHPQPPVVEEPPDLTPRVLEPLIEALTITDDSNVELVCRISNVEPDDVTWTKNSRMARKGSRFKTVAEGDKFSYSISNCLSIDKGLYTVTATTKHGEVSTSCNITYSTDNPDTILDARQSARSARLSASNAASMRAPRFTKPLPDITVTETECATFECKVDASPAPTLQWLCNSKEIKSSSTIDISLEAGLAKLTIKDTDLADQGRYTVVATNTAGTDQTSCFLNVHKPIAKTEMLPPEAPTGKPTVVDISSQGATVTWHEPTSAGGAAVDGYKVEMCKVSLLNISTTKYWKTLVDLCTSTSYRVAQMATSNEYVFRVRAVNMAGEGPASELSDPVLATDRRESTRSISTIGDSESVDYSEYSDYPESEYDPDLDEAFLEHDVIITTDRKFEDQYDVVEELGKGKFGLVYLVIDRTTKRQWAAKKLKCRPSQKPDIMNEVDVMNTLRHPKLVRLWEVFDHGREMVLIQEYVGGGELFERIVDDDFDLKESDCIRFMKQICDGIGYMHSKAIVHLDLKPENVMCVSKHSNQIKLIDFGLARRFKPGDSMKVLFGTPEFVAPEVINYDPVGYNTDMWSVGVITYVLLSGLSPFMGDNDSETLSNVTMTQWDFEDEAFDEISSSAKDFITKLLVKKLEKRLGAVDALMHPWLHDTSRQKQGQTLSKSKSKMKKFLARRKWQKTFKAMVAIRRMQSCTFKLSNKGSSPVSSPTSPQESVLSEVTESDKLSAAPTQDGEQTPTAAQTPLLITSYEQAISSHQDIESATPTSGDIFKYPASRDRKFNESETGSEDNASPQVSPPMPESDKDRMSDTKDSGYEGRKLTREIDPEADGDNSVTHSIIVQHLPEEIHVIEGDCARFDVEIESCTDAKVEWFRDSTPIVLSDRIEVENEGQRYALIIRDIKFSDDAEYECRVVNEHGEESTFGELYIVRNV